MLTPHAGELAAMPGADRADVEAAPLHHARARGRAYGAVVLLKGRHTLVARPDGRVRATTTGTPWLATAGAGDVLGGLIGALLAAGLDAVRRRLGRVVAARRRRDPRLARRPARRERRGARPSRRSCATCTRDGRIRGMTALVRPEIVVDLAAIRHNVRDPPAELHRRRA